MKKILRRDPDGLIKPLLNIISTVKTLRNSYYTARIKELEEDSEANKNDAELKKRLNECQKSYKRSIGQLNSIKAELEELKGDKNHTST